MDRTEITLVAVERYPASWLNLVERFFWLLTDKALRHGVLTLVKEFDTTIHDCIAHHHGDPKPFVWAQLANKILEKVERAKPVS